ncbi:MAG: SLC13 family permease [Ardenticatenaceae bacterium]|nr:SLC13 family permease [Ardenticatenaceae bacterium]
MTAEILLVIAILAVAILLFVTEKLRVDVVALLVLAALVVGRLVTPEEALSGFSNSAVVTVWAVFILSGGLGQTGIANQIGKQVLRLAGEGEVRLLIVIMITAGVMSAFMNNIGVAALLLPVILDIARQTKRPPSKLLLPLVFGALLGGTLTLIGTPPNILVSDALRDAGLRPFSFFDYAPAGAVVLLAGTAFMVLVGRHLLPVRDPIQAITSRDNGQADELYELHEVLARITIPPGSGLAGKTLAESRIGRALGLNILAVMCNGRHQFAPTPETILHEGDCLLALGRLDRLHQLSQQPNFIVEDKPIDLWHLMPGPVGMAEFQVTVDSPYVGQTLLQLDFHRQLGVNVLAIRRNGGLRREMLRNLPLEAGDWLLVQGEDSKLEMLRETMDFRVLDEAATAVYQLDDRLLTIRIPENSDLAGKTLAESRLGRTYGLTAVSLQRTGQPEIVPGPETELAVDDTLVVAGDPRNLTIIRDLQGLIIDPHPAITLEQLATGPMALTQAILSPFTTLAGKTLQELRFRERFGLNVLAIWHNGRAYRSNLAERPLQLGDALLLYGLREKINLLGHDPEFLVLEEEAQAPLKLEKAPLAGTIMLGVIFVVLLGWLPIAIAAIIGATLMVITGCLDMEEAYRFIEWKAVFLIAGMLPLGIAMDQSGTAAFLAQGMMGAIGGLGPHAVLAGLFVLSMLATLFMPNPVVAVLMAPIALSAAADLGVSPYPLMMGIAFGASASFLSPVGHPANVLVMGPGGYRFTDYLKVGLPLVLVLIVVVVTAVPLFWPF